MKLTNSDIYSIICNEIQNRYNNYELTLEQAQEVCDHAYLIYIESEDDPNTSVIVKKDYKSGDRFKRFWKSYNPSTGDKNPISGKSIIKRSEDITRQAVKDKVDKQLEKQQEKWEQSHPGQEYPERKKEKDRQILEDIEVSKHIPKAAAGQIAAFGAATPPGFGTIPTVSTAHYLVTADRSEKSRPTRIMEKRAKENIRKLNPFRKKKIAEEIEQ